MLKMRDLLQEGRNIQQVFKKTVLNEETFLQKAFSGKIKPTTKEQVESILKSLRVRNYKINSDLTVDVRGNVNISSKKLKVIPVNFKGVGGNFLCHGNNLTTLEGAPELVGGNFYCHKNELTTLKGAPRQVGGDFACSNNKLTTLQDGPKFVEGYFTCSENNLTTLKGAPREVGGTFNCANNKTQFTESDVSSVCNVISGRIITQF